MRKPDEPEGHRQSFADVLSNLGNTHRWSFGHPGGLGASPAEQLSVPWLAASRSSEDEDEAWSQRSAGAGEQGEPAGFAAAVRPYTWTRGRTRPAYDLAMEALVSTTEQGCDIAALTSVEHRAVAELCRGPRSVAEIAALLDLPLGVARVLLGDMADIGLVVVHRTATSSGDLPESGFMERVLSGLRQL